MIELALMDPSKETDNKLRWETDVEGISFKLYVPKSRVPQPWPMRIQVHVGDVQTKNKLQPRSEALGVLERPIVAIVERVTEHTQTVRFRPRGDQKDWEIGEPYIPRNLLPSPDVQTVRIEVQWDRSAGDWSQN